MVRFGQLPGEPGEVPAQPDWAGIRTLTLRDYLLDPGRRGPLLVDRHLLILVTVGHGTQEIDFRAYPCRPGSLLWVRPGQVVQHGGPGGLDAVMVSWTPETMRELGVSPIDPPFTAGYWQLAGEDEDAVINEVSQLVVDCQRHDGGALAGELLRHQLAVLLLRLALLPREPADPGPPPGRVPPIGYAGDRFPAGVGGTPDGTDPTGTFWRLRHEVECSYGQTRRVEDYAGRLECSVRTLTRACLAATGRSAKQVIDERVALQARRLLAATDLPVAEIGRRLGFPEPTNFGRFFQREVGRSPGAYRAALTGRIPGQERPAAPPRQSRRDDAGRAGPDGAARPGAPGSVGRRPDHG